MVEQEATKISILKLIYIFTRASVDFPTPSSFLKLTKFYPSEDVESSCRNFREIMAIN